MLQFSTRVFIFAALFVAQTAVAQDLPTNLTCEQARVWLKQNWYDGKFRNLGYSEARKKMYAFIDNANDSLTCVYSGYRQRHVYGLQSTAILPVNCEHTVPQSFFNDAEPMRADIHHLFPTYDDWNSLRGNFPLVDIPDEQATQWVRNLTSQTARPTSNIDEWSEFNARNSTFEPREEQKGNTARAIFYFFTVYPTQAGSITRVSTLETLRRWHEQDPPDAREIARNAAIGQYQGNRNFFVDNPSWVNRAWFCTTTSTNDVPAISDVLLAPNPVTDLLSVHYTTQASDNQVLSVLNAMGQMVWQKDLGLLPAGPQLQTVETADLAPGFYAVRIATPSGAVVKTFVKS